LKRYYYSLKFTDEITPYVNIEVVQQLWRSLALFPGVREGREVFVHALNCGKILASYPGLFSAAFVACSTNVGEGLVKLSHVV